MLGKTLLADCWQVSDLQVGSRQAGKMANSHQPACMRSLCVLGTSQHTLGLPLISLLSHKYSGERNIVFQMETCLFFLSSFFSFFFIWHPPSHKSLSGKQGAEGKVLHNLCWSFSSASADGTVLFSNCGHPCNAKYFIKWVTVNYDKRLLALMSVNVNIKSWPFTWNWCCFAGGVEHKEYELRLFLVALTLFFLSLGEERENLWAVFSPLAVMCFYIWNIQCIKPLWLSQASGLSAFCPLQRAGMEPG